MIPKLSREQERAREAIARPLADPVEADRVYDTFPDSHGGRILSTDIARFLDTR